MCVCVCVCVYIYIYNGQKFRITLHFFKNQNTLK